MKTNYVIRICLVAVSFSVLLACKKDNVSSGNTPATSDLQTSTDDQTMASNENDALSDDVTVALTANNSFARIFADRNASSSTFMRVEGDSPVCDATLSYDTTGDYKHLTITYNGTNCWGNRVRTGTVVISEPRGVHWKDSGATVSISIQQLTITRAIDGKSIVVNGRKTIKNTSGGLLTDLAMHAVTHEINDSLSISCDKGVARTWNVAKHRVFVYDNGIKLTTTGTHSDGTHSDIAEWGSNRFGISFSSRITVPKIITQSCGFRLVKGQDTFTRGDNFMAVVTYGLDASGNAVTSCPLGNFFAQVAWTYTPTGKTGTFVFQY